MDKEKKGILLSVRKGVNSVLLHNEVLSRGVATARFLFTGFGERIPPYLQELIDSCVEPEKAADKKYVRKLVWDMFYSRAFYQTNYKDYFNYGFESKTPEERYQYIGWKEQDSIYSKLDKSGKKEIFDDKLKTYEVFKEFYHRDVFALLQEDQEAQLTDFLDKHPEFIVKPLDASGGKGIAKLRVEDYRSKDELFEELKNRVPCLLEECIIQDLRMARFHPDSINTIRYNTFYYNGQLTRLQAVLRMGRGHSVTDNATAGGIYALIDIDKGILRSDAYSFKNERFTVHPDTGVKFMGAEIPKWKELNELLEKVVRVVPEQIQVGWDFALSPDGWVMIEGNTRPGLQCYDNNTGLRDLVKSTFGQIVPMKR